MEWGLGTFFPLKMAIYKYQLKEIRKLLRNQFSRELDMESRHIFGFSFD